LMRSWSRPRTSDHSATPLPWRRRHACTRDQLRPLAISC
jgi:hypothetical protein